MGRVVDPDVADDDDDIPAPAPKPPKFMGRVVDPDVADDDEYEQDLPIEHLSDEPPLAIERPARRKRKSSDVPDDPSLRPHAFPPLPPSEVLLDPAEAPPPIPEHRLRRAAPSVLSPTMTAVFGALFGLAGIVALFAVLNRFSPQSGAIAAEPVKTAASAPTVITAKRAFDTLPDFDEDGPVLPGPWRVTALKDDPNVRLIEGDVGLDPFVKTLQKKGVSKRETYRILTALKKFDALKRPGKHDHFIVALDRAKGRIKAFELLVSALEVYQAREGEDGLLAGIRLDMKVAQRQRKTAIRLTGGDLAKDLQRGRLRESVLQAIDKAFDGRASVASMPKNSTLRVILQEKTALGRFAEYDYVEALEYISSKPDTKPLRIYRFQDGHRYGYFDQAGHEPYRGGWRKPCPGAPMTSPFNPKRFHPVLKVIRPHQGTDFGAPIGTPVYATSYGTVDWVGPRGPAGNLVVIKHPGNIESYYMHLSRFASGLSKGDKVETFQLIGQVGNTGRSTGPHLHFGIKKNDHWIDPMSLQLDGDRVVTASLREQFEKVKAEYDGQLDAIELPPGVSDEPEPAASAPGPEDPAPDDPAPGKPASNKPDPADSPVHPEDVGENFDDEELEPKGSTAEDPEDDPLR